MILVSHALEEGINSLVKWFGGEILDVVLGFCSAYVVVGEEYFDDSVELVIHVFKFYIGGKLYDW
jgi:hypothetical protein